jgi:membrane protease subunit HflK
VRATGAPSEIGRLAAPLARLLDAAWRRMHWWIVAMVVLYAFSGITIVKSDEVAVILRWGRLVGDTPALQEHAPGLLFALPRPIDTVVRVPVRHINEVAVTTLAPAEDPGDYASTLDPVTDGYALTGDQNIVHATVVARYRIRDAAEWAFYGPSADDVLRVEVTAAMVQSLGEVGVDRVLADGRKDLIAKATERAQAGLDACHSGLELASLELTRLSPPGALASEFTAVQSAFIEAETRRKEAQAYAETAVPQAQAQVDTMLQEARGAADAERASARGDAAAFTALALEYRANPSVVRERLYRDAVERATSRAGSVRWVPPPTGARYNGVRITIPSGGSPVAAPAAPEDDER